MIELVGHVQRILHADDPRGDDYRAAQEWVTDIRSRLVQLRGELENVGRIEASFPHDRLCDKVAGSLTLAIIALYGLIDDEKPRSLGARAEGLDALWADVAANPDLYVIKDGRTWEWRPLGPYTRKPTS